MTPIFNHCTSLIGVSPDDFRVWGRFDDQRAGFGATEITIIVSATVLFLAVAISSYWRARRQRQVFWHDSSSRLFRELCRAHRLNLASKRLLKRLASAHGVESAADLFIEPEYFESANPPAALKSSADELRQLRHRLFD
jgi:hypothetical protein